MLLQPFRWIAWFLLAIVVRLRYTTKVVGLREAKAKPGPYLVMPNHPAFADPPNVIAHLWPHFRFRPVVNEVNFQNPFLGPLGALMRAIHVPDMEHTSANAHIRAQQAVQVVIDAIKKGDNVVLWPSGRLMRDGVERLGGARAVSDILKACPELTVVLVRTGGLWGSSWSWADGPIPPLFPLLFQSFGRLLASLFFFMPRRSISQTVESFTASERPGTQREVVNSWLEAWYNADAKPEKDDSWPGEVPTFVPYHYLFGPRRKAFPPPYVEPSHDLSKVTPAIKAGVAEIIEQKTQRKLSEAEQKAETSFLELGIDSLDGMEITLLVEQRFGFQGGGVPQSLGQLWAIAIGSASQAPPKPPPAAWFQVPSDAKPVEIVGETIPEAIVNRCFLHPRDTAVADDLSGTLSYERLLLGAWLMSQRLVKYPEPNLGLLLPASVAGDLALLSFHLAGKLPVILNWTTGPSNLAHAVQLMGLKRVVSSKAFIDRTHLVVPDTEFVFLEELRKLIGKREALTKLARLRLMKSSSRSSILKHAIADPQKPAVVLFTSGSEKAPKAVPLTHANAISDLRMVFPLLGATRADSVLGFLPLFHSFGHTITGLFPLLTGVKNVHHPDPTDALGLVRKTAAYKPTLVAGTPTFLGFMLDRAKPGELDSLRLIVVGAEKCPQAIFDRAKQLAPNATIMEGYGITECSPVVSVNPWNSVRPGTIGKPIVGLETRIVDVETRQPVAAGAMGLLFVSGANVFPGYLGHDGPQPFEEIDGKRWYDTGDLASLDEAGYLVFHGRLKRFIKAGGEMISLPALEEPFVRKYPPQDTGPRVAVEGIETPDGRRIVLFTTEEIAVKDANAILQGEGFRGVLRLDAVERVEAIPVLGTGKTDYKVLRARISA